VSSIKRLRKSAINGDTSGIDVGRINDVPAMILGKPNRLTTAGPGKWAQHRNRPEQRMWAVSRSRITC